MKPKKYLGQHFLSHRSILETMVRAAHVTKRDVVLEVGPGKGSLTEILAKHAKRVIAIEKDRDLIPLLREKFLQIKNVEIIEGDILRVFNAKQKTKNHRPRQGEAEGGQKLKTDHVSPITNHYKVVANIPYYLTGRLIRLFLESPHKPSIMVLMIQREVAERIVGKRRPSTKLGVNKESLLSISVKAYGTPKIIRVVPRGAFNPPPKVDSAIIAIEKISDAWFTENRIKPEDFFAMVRKAFQNKRKMLRKSLLSVSLVNNKAKQGVFRKSRVGARPNHSDDLGGKDLRKTSCEALFTKRPEDLSLENWKEVVGLYTPSFVGRMRQKML